MQTDIKVKFKPIGERILVMPAESEEKTDSGIYVPDMAKEKPQTGFVVAVGDKVNHVLIGSEIAFGKYSGSDITIDGEDFLILKEEEVFGML